MIPMRTFCTEGPIDTEKNYYLPRTALLEEGLKKVDDWRYFTIFAPRQSGKTTYCQLLINEIDKAREAYLPVWLSFEKYGTVTKRTFMDFFQDALNDGLGLSIKKEKEIQRLYYFIEEIIKVTGKELIMIIDEVEGLQNSEFLNLLMHMIRDIYHQREKYGLRSVILTGVSNISDILQKNASPFNISDQLNVPYFTKEETRDLLEQHEQETSQTFEDGVKELIWQNTAGQPGLVNALARDLVEKKAPDKETIPRQAFDKTLNDFMKTYIDKNIANIINKAKREEELVRKIVFEPNTVEFNVYDERIKYLYVNGVIDNCGDVCCVRVPLYYKALYEYLKPRVNGERKHMIQRTENLSGYTDSEGNILVERLMDKYIAYVNRRGGVQFRGKRLYEGAYQYNLDAFLTSYIEEIGGKCFPEAQIEGGSVDLMLLHKDNEYLIEIKTDPTPQEYKKGKQQIAQYVKRSARKEGYYVIFDSLTDTDTKTTYTFETVTIKEWMIQTDYGYPSKGR